MARKLTTAIQVFIVEQLACFEGPQHVVDTVKQQFGVVVSPQLVEHYRPTPGETTKWKDLFDQTRKAFLDRSTDEAIAQRVWRLRVLERGVRRAEKAGNYKLVAELLEQAAKEEGGMYNRNTGVGAPAAELSPQEAADQHAMLMKIRMFEIDWASGGWADDPVLREKYVSAATARPRESVAGTPGVDIPTDDEQRTAVEGYRQKLGFRQAI